MSFDVNQICFAASHGDITTVSEYLIIDDENVSVPCTAGYYKDQAITIPINLSGLMNGDTDDLIGIAIYWYSGSTLLFGSNFWFSCDLANNRYKIRFRATEYDGTPTNNEDYTDRKSVV